MLFTRGTSWVTEQLFQWNLPCCIIALKWLACHSSLFSRAVPFSKVLSRETLSVKIFPFLFTSNTISKKHSKMLLVPTWCPNNECTVRLDGEAVFCFGSTTLKALHNMLKTWKKIDLLLPSYISEKQTAWLHLTITLHWKFINQNHHLQYLLNHTVSCLHGICDTFLAIEAQSHVALSFFKSISIIYHGSKI